jgi:hypothetical protein
MFGAAFAGSVGEPILKQQQNDIALLRDRLNQIAATERAMLQQRLAGEQAMERTMHQQQMQNFRTSLTQIQANERASGSIRARREEDLAEIGFAGDITTLDDQQLINYASVLSLANQAEEDEIEREKRDIDLAMATMRLEDQLGIRIDPAVWNNPEQVRVLSEAAAEKRALDEAQELGLEFTLGEMRELAEMGTIGADMIDAYFGMLEGQGIEVNPGLYFRGMMAKAMALHPDKQLSDFQRANTILRAAQEGIYNRYFPGGNIPGSMDRMMDPEAMEQFTLMNQALEELHNNEAFSNMLQGATGWGTGALVSPGTLTESDIISMNEQIRYDRAQAEQEEGARKDNLEDFTATQTVQRERIFQLVKEQFDALVEAQDFETIENMAFGYDERAVSIETDPEYVAPPGQDALGRADYMALSEWIRGNLRVLQDQLMREQFANVGGTAEVPRQFGVQR